jgi:hypothetical protein
MHVRFVRQLPLVALLAALSACGGGGSGGGVDSTPPPPTGGTPTPTPTPPPTGVNSQLIGTLASETFVNRNAELTISGSKVTGQATGASAVQRQLTIVYNAANQSYTLTANDRTLTFSAADLDAAQSTATLAVYVKKDGSGSDSLILTRGGTSGRFTYRYVGGTFWQRVTDTPTTLGINAVAAVYGVATPAAAVPRTGTASYGVDLIGYMTSGDNFFATTGQGRMDVDFATGTVVNDGTLAYPGSQPVRFRSAATLSSSNNSFTGTFTFDDSGRFEGTIEGAFFGPAAEEVGASWAATQTNGRAAAGVLLGRRDGASLGNASFASTPNNQIFTTSATRTTYSQGSGAPTDAARGSAAVTIHHNAATDVYTLIAPDRSVYLGAPTVAGGPVTSVGIGTREDRLEFVRADTSYVRLARWSGYAGAGSTTKRFANHIVFGMPTAATAVPRTGEGA